MLRLSRVLCDGWIWLTARHADTHSRGAPNHSRRLTLTGIGLAIEQMSTAYQVAIFRWRLC